MATFLRARASFERNRAACGAAGLLTEEYDVAERQLRGNAPQAFVHALLLQCAVSLSTVLAGDGLARDGLARDGVAADGTSPVTAGRPQTILDGSHES